MFYVTYFDSQLWKDHNFTTFWCKQYDVFLTLTIHLSSCQLSGGWENITLHERSLLVTIFTFLFSWCSSSMCYYHNFFLFPTQLLNYKKTYISPKDCTVCLHSRESAGWIILFIILIIKFSKHSHGVRRCVLSLWRQSVETEKCVEILFQKPKRKRNILSHSLNPSDSTLLYPLPPLFFPSHVLWHFLI